MAVSPARVRIRSAGALLAIAVSLSASTAAAEWTSADDDVVSQFAGVLALARGCNKLDQYGPILSKAYAGYLDAHATTAADRKHAADLAVTSLEDAAKEVEQSPNREMYCLMAGGIVLNFLRETAGPDDGGDASSSDSDPDQ